MDQLDPPNSNRDETPPATAAKAQTADQRNMVQLGICFAGLQASYIVWGIMQVSCSSLLTLAPSHVWIVPGTQCSSGRMGVLSCTIFALSGLLCTAVHRSPALASARASDDVPLRGHTGANHDNAVPPHAHGS
jgi:hypothetical protein